MSESELQFVVRTVGAKLLYNHGLRFAEQLEAGALTAIERAAGRGLRPRRRCRMSGMRYDHPNRVALRDVLVKMYERTNRHICTGIARAWANHRAAHPPEQLWALVEGDGDMNTVFGSIEEALQDQALDEKTTATLRPCVQAWPHRGAFRRSIDAFLEEINEDYMDAADWSDFGNVDSSIVECNTRGNEIRDLEERFAETFRQWAITHGAGRFAEPGATVSINAWRFTGPIRRFEIYSDRISGTMGPPFILVGHTAWIELCPLCVYDGEYASHCVLPLGHAVPCLPKGSP